MRPSPLAHILLVLSTTTLLLAVDDVAKRPYLALGDSVSFGFINQAGFEYVNAANFIGFPNYIGEALKLTTSNAACPGETTGSFLSADAADNGCRSYRRGGPLRPGLPLHVSYPVTMTQLDYAISFLESHPKTRLVTIGLGADDVFLLQAACQSDPDCIATGLPTVLESVRVNMHTILTDLLSTGFTGTIVVVNYYSTNYSDPGLTALASALNEALAAATEETDAVVADVFTAFQTVPRSGGLPCLIGLLKFSQGTCDVHPSQSGHALIARTVEQALATAVKGKR